MMQNFIKTLIKIKKPKSLEVAKKFKINWIAR